MDKKKINKLKKLLKFHLTKQYINYLAEFEKNESIEEDLNLLFQHDKSLYDRIEEIKTLLVDYENEVKFQQVISQKSKYTNKLIQDIDEQIIILTEEITRTQNSFANNIISITDKEKKIAEVNKRIFELQTLKNRITQAEQDLKPQKRKVGRPKKNQAEITA